MSIDYQALLKKYMQEVVSTEGWSVAERMVLYAQLGTNYTPEELQALRDTFAEVMADEKARCDKEDA